MGNKKIKPTSEQKRVFHYVEKRPENIFIRALAGSGKTTTIIEASKLIPKDKSIMFLAFNKHIQEELKTKLPEHIRCYTTYGLGVSAIKRKYGDKIQFDEFKVDKLIKKYQRIWKLEQEFKSMDVLDEYLFNLKKMVDLCRVTLTLKKEYVGYIARKHEIKIDEKRDIKRILKLLDEVTLDRKTFDFVDMIYMPATDKSIWMFPQDYVLIDEIQDISMAQYQIVMKLLKRDRKTGKQTGRLISVGDANQCQPKGTKVLMADGTEKNIEDLKVGDGVVTYDRKWKGKFVGYYENGIYFKNGNKRFIYEVSEIASRRVKTELIRISSGGKTSSYTYNHICMSRINKNTKHKYVLYLMERNGYYRIGIVPLWSSDGLDFLANRSKQEKADKLWILKVYENRQDAYIDEQYFSIKYSIPQMIFHYREQKGKMNQEIIDEFYSRFSRDEMESRVVSLLVRFKRHFDYPIWSKGAGKYFSKNHMFKIHAVNIIPEIMEMCLFDSNNTKTYLDKGVVKHKIVPTYVSIDNLDYYEYDDLVYSLDIHKHHTYVADGILTHNCIYGFNGADKKMIKRFEDLPNTVTLPLTTSFRCSKRVIRKAQTIVPDIKALDDAPEGDVREGSVLKEAQDGDFVLCRTTAPLVKLFFEFITEGKKAVIKGSDIGLQLIGLIGKFKDLKKLKNHWEDVLYSAYAELKVAGVLEPEKDSGYMALNDKVTVLSYLIDMSISVDELKHKIKSIFTDELSGIVLSTVHKSKGLESDRVFIIRPDLLPLDNVIGWQYQQEKNLEYVAITRAKLELIYDREWTDEENETDKDENSEENEITNN